MEYFTKNLWARINDHDSNIRNQAVNDWDIAIQSYKKQFETVSQHLSCRFVREFSLRSELHDYIILGMNLTKMGRKYDCELQLSNGEETILLEMKEIKTMSVDIGSFQSCIQGRLAWGYSEFSLSDNNIKLSVVCDLHNEMQFVFEKIKLIVQV